MGQFHDAMHQGRLLALAHRGAAGTPCRRAIRTAAGAAGAGAAEVEEKTTVNVVMTSAGAAKIAVIKVIREVTGLGLAEAKALADNGGNIKENVERADGDKIKKQLEEAGATVELK